MNNFVRYSQIRDLLRRVLTPIAPPSPSKSASVAPSPPTAPEPLESIESLQSLRERDADKARIKLLERALRQKEFIIASMSDVSRAPMLAQFNELDAEYNKLFERSAKVQQKLFDAEATIRTLTRMNQSQVDYGA